MIKTGVFKYETHVHTKYASACSGTGAREMVNAHIEAGYQGMILTEHFFNGNTNIPRDWPWEDKVKQLLKSYYVALEEAKNKDFDVFLGWECNYKGMDFLTYGLDEDFLLSFPRLLSWTAEEYFDVVHDYNGLIIHAHPFREAPYLSGSPVLFPAYVDGIEVINGGHINNREFDDKALAYAKEHNLLQLSGSDTHGTDNLRHCGLEFDFRLRSIHDFIAAVRSRGYRLLRY